MDSGTVCMWLETDGFRMDRAALMSYAVEEENKEWLIEFRRDEDEDEEIRITFGGEQRRVDFTIPPGTETEKVQNE